MAENLNIFGVTYNNVTGIKATDTNNVVQTYIKPQGTLSIQQNGTGIDVTQYASVNVSVSAPAPTYQTKTVTPTTSQQTVSPDNGYDALSSVTVDAIPNAYLQPYVIADTSSLTQDDYYFSFTASEDRGRPFYTTSGSVTVDLSASSTGNATQAQVLSGNTFTSENGWSIAGTMTNNGATGGTISTQGGTYTIPSGYTSGGTVTANIGTGTATNSGSVSGSSATITTGTNTITLSKSVSITPSVTAGYISSGTAGNVTVSLTGSVTTDPTPTASGKTVTIPAGYYSSQTTKDVSTGSATAPASISGTSATVSTGTNTLTLTKTVSVTPTVSAGYISSGTAGNSSVSLTASVTTKGTATITPTTTNQTIASGTYLTGTQTISGDADLVASNIISTANIFGVQGSVVINKYYTGSSAPSSSLGNNGDIYIQS